MRDSIAAWLERHHIAATLGVLTVAVVLFGVFVFWAAFK